jgi:hypothetical protein
MSDTTASVDDLAQGPVPSLVARGPIFGTQVSPVMEPSGTAPAPPENFIRVSEAKRRYFGGTMSLRWWYRQIEQGKLPHHRAGGAVLLRPVDVEAFIQEGFRAKRQPEPTASEPPAPRPVKRTKSRSAPARAGLRFFTE